MRGGRDRRQPGPCRNSKRALSSGRQDRAGSPSRSPRVARLHYESASLGRPARRSGPTCPSLLIDCQNGARTSNSSQIRSFHQQFLEGGHASAGPHCCEGLQPSRSRFYFQILLSVKTRRSVASTIPFSTRQEISVGAPCCI